MHLTWQLWALGAALMAACTAVLSKLGIDRYYVSQLGDNLGRLTDHLRLAWSRSDLIVMSGGVGPTEDDLTREAIAGCDAVACEDTRVTGRRSALPIAPRSAFHPKGSALWPAATTPVAPAAPVSPFAPWMPRDATRESGAFLVWPA